MKKKNYYFVLYLYFDIDLEFNIDLNQYLILGLNLVLSHDQHICGSIQGHFAHFLDIAKPQTQPCLNTGLVVVG